MSDEVFREYVRGSAFSLTLSKRMIGVLLYLCDKGPEDERLNLAPYQALHRRGLVDFKEGQGYSPTIAGMKVADLLKIAGF